MQYAGVDLDKACDAHMVLSCHTRHEGGTHAQLHESTYFQRAPCPSCTCNESHVNACTCHSISDSVHTCMWGTPPPPVCVCVSPVCVCVCVWRTHPPSVCVEDTVPLCACVTHHRAVQDDTHHRAHRTDETAHKTHIRVDTIHTTGHTGQHTRHTPQCR